MDTGSCTQCTGWILQVQAKRAAFVGSIRTGFEVGHSVSTCHDFLCLETQNLEYSAQIGIQERTIWHHIYIYMHFCLTMVSNVNACTYKNPFHKRYKVCYRYNLMLSIYLSTTTTHYVVHVTEAGHTCVFLTRYKENGLLK